MGLFYTGKGDSGQSNVGGKKVSKDSPEMQALGDLDELNSLVGLVRTRVLPAKVKNVLEEVQQNLFIIQANIGAMLFGSEFPAPPMQRIKIIALEKLIELYEKQVKPRRGFIIPGSNEKSAWFDLVRTVSRRAERSVVALSKRHKVSPEILAYLNRLSSLFFALGRVMAKAVARKEKNPNYK